MTGVVVVNGSEIAAFVQDTHGSAPVKRRIQIETIVEDFLVWRCKKKGPASAPTLLSRGSQSAKGNSNVDTHNTRASDEAIVAAMRMLEGPIHSLLMMSEIMGDAFDHDLQELDIDTLEKRGIPRDGKSMKIILTRGQIDRLSFLWNDVIHRAAKLQKAYLAALDGKEIAA